MTVEFELFDRRLLAIVAIAVIVVLILVVEIIVLDVRVASE
jgi:hypothetical protein